MLKRIKVFSALKRESFNKGVNQPLAHVEAKVMLVSCPSLARIRIITLADPRYKFQ